MKVISVLQEKLSEERQFAAEVIGEDIRDSERITVARR